jgi:3-hydroxyisobutyrate dehydrogenase-like beta-hydroxyacid dehydrogenase
LEATLCRSISRQAGSQESRFSVRLLEKDLSYAIKTAGAATSVLTVSAVRAVFQKTLADNFGDLNMTAVVKLFDRRYPRMQMPAK